MAYNHNNKFAVVGKNKQTLGKFPNRYWPVRTASGQFEAVETGFAIVKMLKQLKVEALLFECNGSVSRNLLYWI